MSMFKQLSLPVGLDNQATFANFYAPNGTPQHMATFLLRDESRMFAYICGPQGSGLSHLLPIILRKKTKIEGGELEFRKLPTPGPRRRMEFTVEKNLIEDFRFFWQTRFS